MKKQTTSALKIFFQKHISFLTILIASVMAICSVPKNNSSFKIFDAKWTSEITPDTVVEEIREDTLVYSDGADTIYLINDTLPYDDSLGLHFRDLEIADNFYVTFGGIDKNVNPGIYGFNVTGMFDPSTLPNDGTSDYAWQWLIDLAPEVLRFPSGSYSKFMHLLHNTDGTDAVGYGYDIYEIARYYDWTDEDMYFDYEELTLSNINRILYDEDIALKTWIFEDHVQDFKSFRDKWFAQQCVTTRYLDDFISLVNQIDEAYPGRPLTKVIVCLNILSETATECRAITDYLRSNDVNVVGVEMGNETYSGYFCDAMEFDEFDDYYAFINGTTLTGNSNVLEDDGLGATDMLDDHNFIDKFKTGGGYNYKIGICGMPLGNDYAFKLEAITAACAASDDWNESLRDKYEEMVDGTSKYKFDAVIMHTYLEADNWGHIPIDNLTPETSCAGEGDLWDFDDYDVDLEDAFDKILGLGGAEGNFRDFIVKTSGEHISYKISMDKFNYYFDFDLTSSERKELWTTEWNLKDSKSGYTELQQAKASIYSNGFTHGHLLLQWWLKDIKVNYDNDYHNNFYTYSTIQNYAGAVPTCLITIGDGIERNYYDKTDCPYDEDCAEPLNCEFDDNWDKRNYHIRRTTYFVTYLFSEIYKQNLKYVPSNFYIGTSTPNVQPTVFIDPNKDYIYLYYSNVKGANQNFILNPEYLINFFTDIAYVDLGEPTLTYLQAEQVYSTSGRSSLYDKVLINTCYDSYDHPFEIKADTEAEIDGAIIEDEANDPECPGSGYAINGCLTAPAYSIGYFKIPIYPIEDPFKTANKINNYDLHIYPNPSATFFQVKSNNPATNSVVDLKITILNLDGKLKYSTNSILGEIINISDLSAGCYLVLIDDGINKFYKKLIKTE
ncbi:MAG: T9SS type A sorting domain-containing protein [Chitinophagales bacterium]